MAKRNGGIIGPSNVPTGAYGGTAKGVWRLRDAFNYIKAGLWPVAGNYPVANSLRFNSGSTDNLTRTPASAGNRTTWTWSGWVKRSILGSVRILFSAGASGANDTTLYFGNSDDKLIFFNRISSSVTGYLETNQLFRDVSAWYHIVAVWNSNNATAGDRMRLYVNGSEITSFATDTNPSLNENSFINNNVAHYIGNDSSLSSSINYGGYLSEVNFIDGQALTPSSFGLTDSATGIWIPKPYYGTYGTNGFYLKFANSAALGTDSSGNGNTWTANNLTSVDQSTDTPTNNFATLNPLDAGGGGSYAEGNLQYTSATSDLKASASSFALNNGNAGKWYWEVKMVSTTGSIYQIGTISSTSSYITQPYSQYNSLGQVFVNGSQVATVSTFTTGDIISASFDATTSEVKYYKNGSLVTTQTISNSNNILMFAGSHSDSSGNTATYQFNFGSPPFTIASGNADGAGFGNFEYAVPSGYYALCTKNLATYG